MCCSSPFPYPIPYWHAFWIERPIHIYVKWTLRALNGVNADNNPPAPLLPIISPSSLSSLSALFKAEGGLLYLAGDGWWIFDKLNRCKVKINLIAFQSLTFLPLYINMISNLSSSSAWLWPAYNGPSGMTGWHNEWSAINNNWLWVEWP